MHKFDNFEYESELFFNLHRHSKKAKKPKQENTKKKHGKKQEKKQEKQEIVTPIIVKFIYTVKVDIDI